MPEHVREQHEHEQREDEGEVLHPLGPAFCAHHVRDELVGELGHRLDPRPARARGPASRRSVKSAISTTTITMCREALVKETSSPPIDRGRILTISNWCDRVEGVPRSSTSVLLADPVSARRRRAARAYRRKPCAIRFIRMACRTTFSMPAAAPSAKKTRNRTGPRPEPGIELPADHPADDEARDHLGGDTERHSESAAPSGVGGRFVALPRAP